MGALVIRDATPADAGVLAEVFRESSLSNDGDRANLLAHPDVLVFNDESVRRGHTVVAAREGRIIGFATAVPDESFLELEDIFVRPECQREGVGSALMEKVLSRATDRGFGRIEVTANPHATAFYEHAGFVEVGVVDTRFGPATRMSRRVERLTSSPPMRGATECSPPHHGQACLGPTLPPDG